MSYLALYCPYIKRPNLPPPPTHTHQKWRGWAEDIGLSGDSVSMTFCAHYMSESVDEILPHLHGYII